MSLLEGRVEDLSHDGAGVVKIDGKVYFVEGALPGELIEFEPRRKRRKKLQGILSRVIEPSPQRVEPRCEYFGVCGGCAQQHLEPDAQLQFKEKVLFDNLERIGNVEPEQRMAPIQGEGWHYRRKARPGIRDVPKKGGILVGFRERSSSYITSLMHCPAMDVRLSDLLPGLHQLVSALSCRSRIPQIEFAAADNEVALVFRHLEPFNDDDLSLLESFARDRQLQLFLQPGGLDSIAPLWPQSPQPLYYRLPKYDLQLYFRPTDFIQVNAEVNERMIDQALSLLEPATGENIMDLFCGLGNFSLPIARSGAGVTGVEADEALVQQGRANADMNGLDNVSFCRADLYGETVAEQLGAQPCDRMLVDPPRSGALEVIRDLVPRVLPEVLVYVSCNPATLARDAGILVNGHGYRMTHAGAIDMFPHTAHVESMARFER